MFMRALIAFFVLLALVVPSALEAQSAPVPAPAPTFTASGTLTDGSGGSATVTVTGVISGNGATVAAGVNVDGCVATVTLTRRSTVKNANGTTASFYTGEAVICGRTVRIRILIGNSEDPVYGGVSVDPPTFPNPTLTGPIT